jgi:hypothetical protein
MIKQNNIPSLLTVKNLAIVIFMLSGAPVTSVRATKIMAGGPVGINIIENHSIGSLSRIRVFVAIAQMSGMLILVTIS